MKAIFKVEWREKTKLENITDIRKYCGEATQAGFLKISEHAKSVTDRNEFIASITMIEWEKP